MIVLSAALLVGMPREAFLLGAQGLTTGDLDQARAVR